MINVNITNSSAHPRSWKIVVESDLGPATDKRTKADLRAAIRQAYKVDAE